MSLEQQYDCDLQQALEFKASGAQEQLENMTEHMRRRYGVVPPELMSDAESMGDVHDTTRYEPDSNITVSLVSPEIGESSQAA